MYRVSFIFVAVKVTITEEGGCRKEEGRTFCWVIHAVCAVFPLCCICGGILIELLILITLSIHSEELNILSLGTHAE